jgi:hypothetical protein
VTRNKKTEGEEITEHEKLNIREKARTDAVDGGQLPDGMRTNERVTTPRD